MVTSHSGDPIWKICCFAHSYTLHLHLSEFTNLNLGTQQKRTILCICLCSLLFAFIWMKYPKCLLFFPLQVESKFIEVALRMRDYEMELYNHWKAKIIQTLPLLMKRSLLIMVNSTGTVYSIQPNTVRCSDWETCLLALRKRWSKLIMVFIAWKYKDK